MRNYLLVGAVAIAFTGMASQVKAGFADTLQNGQNSYEDISREQVFFTNPSAGLSVGDVIVGFSQIQTRTGGPRTFDTMYAVFSQTVTAISGNTVSFGPTAAANPESLQSILPGHGISSGVLAAVFDRAQGNNFPLDLVNTAPGGATNMNGYLQNIAANGTYETGFGFSSTKGQHDFLTAVANEPLSTVTPTTLNMTPNSITLASFFGGLSEIDNNTTFKFNQAVLGNDFLLHDLGIVSGSLRGASDDANYSIFSGTGAGSTNTGGVGDNASFVVNVTGVPEPSTLVLFGAGLFGFASRHILRRRNRVVK